jgi:hypothetical protein
MLDFLYIWRFIEEDCVAGLCSVDKGDALMHNHFQMVMKGNFSSRILLIRRRKKTKVCLGWDVNPLTCHVVSCKKLRDEGLHIFKGMMGYCTEDKWKEQFEFVHHNLFAQNMNDGKLESAKFSKIGFNNRVCLSHSNTLQRAHQRTRFRMREHLGVMLT